jgi:hypothetical protein
MNRTAPSKSPTAKLGGSESYSSGIPVDLSSIGNGTQTLGDHEG